MSKQRCPSCGYSEEDACTHMDHGFILANGDGDRFIKADGSLEWTDKRDNALWLARRQDADALATIVEDAWRVVAVAAPFKCASRSANTGANDPQDCDWPLCGCDGYAIKVIEALQECGWGKPVAALNEKDRQRSAGTPDYCETNEVAEALRKEDASHIRDCVTKTTTGCIKEEGGECSGFALGVDAFSSATKNESDYASTATGKGTASPVAARSDADEQIAARYAVKMGKGHCAFYDGIKDALAESRAQYEAKIKTLEAEIKELTNANHNKRTTETSE